MQITIINVSAPEQKMSKAGKPYTAIAVMYTDSQGARKTQNILDRKLIQTFQGFSQGDFVDVVTTPNGAYETWVAASKVSAGASASVPASSHTPTKAPTSTYATKEERAQTQVYIVRQSSITAAINLLSIGAKSPPSQADILITAKGFEDHVLGSTEKERAVDFDNFEDDIPY
jgi:hypothetical protein